MPRIAPGGGLSPAPSASDAGYDIVILAGQSNMQGESGSIDPLVDVTDPRIWAFPSTGSNANRIVQAADPLAHLGGASQVGPGMEFARWYVGTMPANRRVLLVPTAYSGTSIISTGQPKWDSAPASAADPASLYSRTIAQAQAALAAAGDNARFVAVLWVQGESDQGRTATEYRTALESVIDGFRDRLGVPDLPFVIGSMLPEAIAGNGALTVIDGVHKQIPSRKPRTAFVPGATGYNRDGIHYTSPGMRAQGRRFLAGYLAAAGNVAPADAVPANPPAPPAPPVVTPPAASGRTAPAVNLSIAGTVAYPTGKFGNGVDTSAGRFTGPGWGNFKTLEFWAKASAVGTYVAFGDPAVNAGAWFGQNAGKAHLAFGSSNLDSGETIADGAWHHLALTFSNGVTQAGTVTLWVDGANTAGSSAAYAGEFNQAGAFGAFGAAYNWLGVLDELRISSSVRYAADFTPPAAPFTPDADTLGLYHLESDGTDDLSASSIVTDTFTRPDSATSLGAADTGQAWLAVNGTWGIENGKARPVSGQDANMALIDTGTTDQRITVTVTEPQIGIVARSTAGGTSNYVSVANALYRCDATWSNYVLLGALSTTVQPGDTVELAAIGSTITVSVNGTVALTYTDTTPPGGTYAGLRLNGTTSTPRADNFTVRGA